MANALSSVKMENPEVSIVPNVNAEGCISPAVLKKLLVQQVTSPVRWRESIMWMTEQGVTEIWEVGAGKALSGMVRRIDKTISTRAIGSSNDVEAALSV